MVHGGIWVWKCGVLHCVFGSELFTIEEKQEAKGENRNRWMISRRDRSQMKRILAPTNMSNHHIKI